MKCEEALHLIQRGLDNDLTPSEEEKLLKHLAECSSCQAESAQLRSLNHSLASLSKVNPPYSIVDAMLSELDALGETEDLDETKDMVTELKPSNRKRVKKRFWMPGLAMVAGLFIVLILLNERDLSPLEKDSFSSGEPEMAIEQGQPRIASTNETMIGDQTKKFIEPEEEMNSFNAIPAEEGPTKDIEMEEGPGLASRPDNQGEEVEESGMSLTEFTVDEEEKYPSPDDVYTAYLGLHHEELFIDKEGEAYYISKNSWKAPWVVEEVTWIHNEQLYYVLHQPESDEYQYWLIDVEERTEEQLEEALRN